MTTQQLSIRIQAAIVTVFFPVMIAFLLSF